MKAVFITGVLFATLFGFGCAGAPKPTDQLVRTEAALRAAEEVGASDVPQAELHQTLAREQLEKARKLIGEDENAQAKSALERAKADAELALALAREEQARTAAENAEAALSSAEQGPANPVQSSGSN